MVAIGIDIGGTRTRAAMVNEGGDILGWQETATSALGRLESLLDWIGGAVKAFRADAASDAKSISHIGLALPGLLDREHGAVSRAVNIPWIEQQPIRSQLEVLTGLPVKLISDADAATWGEYASLQPRPERFVHLRLGTGVALGVVVAGRLQRLARPDAAGGHLDVLVVDETPEAQHCLCGRCGCLEAYVGRVALRRRMGELGIAGEVNELSRLIDERDAAARGIVSDAAMRLASAISNICAEFAPDLIVVGGGIVAAVPAILAECRQLATKCSGLASDRLQPSTLGNNAGVIGAARARSFA